MPKALADVRRKAILADVGSGTSCAQIARDHGVSRSTVSKLAKDAGIAGAFERSQTKKATAALVADSKAVRAATSRRFLAKANDLLDQMEQPHTAFAFGGRDNVYAEHLFPRPPVDALRTLMITAAVAFDKHLAAERHDADESGDLTSVDAWLAAMTEGAGH